MDRLRAALDTDLFLSKVHSIREDGDNRQIEQARDRAGLIVSHRQVRSAVAVQIRGRDSERKLAKKVIDVGLKGTVAIAKQNGNGARHVRRAKQDYVTACEVEIPIAVKIRHGQKNRAAPGWVNNLGLERAIAIAE